MSRNARRIFAGLAGSLALYPADVLLGPKTFWPVELVASILIAGVGLGVAAVWLWRWPTRRQSVVFTTAGSLCIATGSLLQHNPFVALLAAAAMAIPGGYFAFFHTAKYMAANFWLAGTVGAVEVARALTAVCNESALIGRIGGEEFLVADIVKTQRPPEWSRSLCDAVETAASPVTASVGTATLALGTVGCDDAEQAYRLLVARADTAMYEAKRHGGNHARHHVP